jgi:predicted transcriptional regulator
MQKKIIHPQEIIVWNMIPFLRKELASHMKSTGIDQKTIASLLNVTEPAISQYFNEKRAQKKIKISPKLKRELALSSRNIIKNKDSMISEIQRLLSLDETKFLICSIHKKEFGALKNCTLCTLGDR